MALGRMRVERLGSKTQAQNLRLLIERGSLKLDAKPGAALVRRGVAFEVNPSKHLKRGHRQVYGRWYRPTVLGRRYFRECEAQGLSPVVKGGAYIMVPRQRKELGATNSLPVVTS